VETWKKRYQESEAMIGGYAEGEACTGEGASVVSFSKPWGLHRFAELATYDKEREMSGMAPHVL